MGANAQTTVPTFTTGQVLTADQQNQSARTGVPVFATTVTRDAGFGGTGEKTLAEGQLCYVEGTGLQSYNGSSWVTWGTNPNWKQLATGTLTGASVTISNLSGQNLHVYCEAWSSSSAGDLRIRINGNSGSNYVPSTGDVASVTTSLALSASIAAASSGYSSAFIPNARLTPSTMVISGQYGGIYALSETVDSITLFPSAGNFDAGTYYVWSES